MERILTPWYKYTVDGKTYHTRSEPSDMEYPTVHMSLRFIDYAGIHEYLVAEETTLTYLKASNLKDAKAATDERLVKNGWILLTDKQWAKMKVLL
jgi:hypothetical protein